MTVQYTVRFLCQDVEAERQRIILATLPNRFRIVDSLSADILVVPCSAGSESMLDAVGPSTLGLFLSAPGRLSAESFGEITRRAVARPIGLALAVADALTDQALSALRDGSADAPVIVDVVSEVASSDAGALRAAAFEQLMLLHALSGSVSGLRLQALTGTQLIAAVETGPGWQGVRISARRSFRDRVTLHAVSRSDRRQLTVTPDPHAAPARIMIFDKMGCRAPMPEYQGGYRRSWLSLHESLSSGSPANDLHAAAARVLALLRL